MGVGGLSVGLSTGIDYATLLENLVSLERRPIDNIQQKVELNRLKQEAIQELNTQALGAKLTMFDLSSLSTFNKKTVNSSNESILTGSANNLAQKGSHSLQVVRLASSSINTSSGVEDPDDTTLNAGTLSFELGGRRLDSSTALERLNDGNGVQRGIISMTDGNGKSENFDLRSAVTIDDVFNILNGNGMGLTFSTDRDSSGLTNVTGYTISVENNGSSQVTMADVGSTKTLSDLGFSTSGSKTIASMGVSSGVSQIAYVTSATRLSQINDGFGLMTTSDSSDNDLRFYVEDLTTSLKKSVEVNFSGTEDVGDVLNAINSALFDAKVNQFSKASLSSDGVSIEFTGNVSGFKNINGSRAATDLGLTQTTQSGSVTVGEALIAEMGSSLIRNLHGGHGVDGIDTSSFNVTSRAGDIYNINLNGATSVSDVLRVITESEGDSVGQPSDLRAEINESGNGIVIHDDSTGTKSFKVEDVSGSVAKQLGFDTTLTIDHVLFNPIDITNDIDIDGDGNIDGVGRRSVAYLSPNALPVGITENEMVGRSLEHTFSSMTADNVTPGVDEDDYSRTETSRIIAFEKASETSVITALEASVSSTANNAVLSQVALPLDGAPTGDLLTDATNLNNVINPDIDTDMLVGATLKFYSDDVGQEVSSTIVSYNSTTRAITLADEALSTALNGAGFGTAAQQGAHIKEVGYSIVYNHKVILEYELEADVIAPDATRGFNGTNLITGGGGDDGLNTDLNEDRLIGSTIYVNNSGSTFYGRVLDKDTSGADIQLTIDWESATPAVADIRDGNITFTYTPVQFTDKGVGTRKSFLSTHGGNADTIKIVGVGSGESLNGGNLENRMISGVTLLDDLNGGQGIGRGAMRISLAGTSAEIDLTDTSIQTVQDLMTTVRDSLSNVDIEVNDRGDGIRIFDTTTSSTSGITITDVSGTSARDLNLLTTISQQTPLAVSSGDDFYSLRSTVAAGGVSPGSLSYDITLNNMGGLLKSEVIGSRLRYVDSGTGDTIHGIITNYITETADTTQGTFTVAGLSSEQGTAIAFPSRFDFDVMTNTNNFVTNLTDNDPVFIDLKKHMNTFEAFAVVDNSDADLRDEGGTNKAPLGALTLSLDRSSVSDLGLLNAEELVGSYINFYDTANINEETAIGSTALITGFNEDTALPEITIQTTDIGDLQIDNLISLGRLGIGLSRNGGSPKHIQAGDITQTSSFLTDIADSGYISVTATVNTNTTSNTITSDQFANLDPRDVIGALITVSSSTSVTEGSVAIVTDYDEASRTITYSGGFYDDTGTQATVPNDTLDANDEVYLTFAKELEGQVLRSNNTSDAAPITGLSVPVAGVSGSETRLIQVDATVLTDIADDKDKYIGATISFDGAGTPALQNENRTIIDVINEGGTYSFVLDTSVSAIAAADNFDINFEELKGTIDHVDFASGVITTRERMLGSMGDRSFTIHPTVDGSYQKEIEVDATDTLEDLAAKINGANVGATASVINDGGSSNPYRLSITADNTGTQGAVNVSSTVSGFDFSLTTRGDDAKVVMGIDSGSSSIVSSNTNTITDAIAGLTLNLLQASNEVVTLTVDNDREGIVEKTSTLIEEVNLLLDSAQKLIALETEVEIEDEDGNITTETQKGLLFGDSTVRTMINEVKTLFNRIVGGLSGTDITSFADIGINLNTSGEQYDFDQDLMTQLLSSKFEQVKDLFTTNPNIAPDSSLSISNNFLQTNYNINGLRNGNTTSSGFSETGNGTNGVKLLAGDSSKSLTYNFGEVKNLYGFKLHHHVPEDLTARYQVNSAGGATLSSTTLTDASNLDASNNLISDQLIGSTVVVGSKQAKITAYNSTSGALTLDTDISSETVTNGYTITTSSGENISFSHNAVLEYRDPITNTYKTYSTYRDRGDGTMTIVFPGNLRTDSVRIRYDNNSGDSEDFTTNGYFVRLMEMELLDSQGLGAQFSREFASFTDANTGSLALATQAIDDLNNSYARQITRLTESLSRTQDRYIKEFQNLEQIVSNLNSQSQFFQSQISGLPKAFSYRGNNGQ